MHKVVKFAGANVEIVTYHQGPIVPPIAIGAIGTVIAADSPDIYRGRWSGVH